MAEDLSDAIAMAASGTYIVNDLWDLPSDRLHPRKRMRPLASCALTIPRALAAAVAAAVHMLQIADALGYAGKSGAHAAVREAFQISKVLSGLIA